MVEGAGWGRRGGTGLDDTLADPAVATTSVPKRHANAVGSGPRVTHPDMGSPLIHVQRREGLQSPIASSAPWNRVWRMLYYATYRMGVEMSGFT